MTALRGPGLRLRRDREELTKFQMGIGLVVGIIGAIVGTIAFLIVITIIIGLADGH